MPKRGAEKELNKDNADIEEIDETPSVGLSKANDEQLSQRRIKGLPKRTHSASKMTSSNPQSFSGFSASSLNSMAAPGGPSPAVAPTATSTAKSFASFLQPASSSPPSTLFQSQQPVAPPPAVDTVAQDNTSATKYYTSLRGLNVSLLEALTSITENDPFADIANMFERYKSLRLDVQKEYDDSKKPTPLPVKPLTTIAPPAPPSSGFKGFGFDKSPSTSSASSDKKGGFMPQPTAASNSSGFSFLTPPPNSSTANPFTIPSKTLSFSPSGTSVSSTLKPVPTSEAPSSASSSFLFKPSTTLEEVKDKSAMSSKPFTFSSSSSDANAKPTSFSFGPSSTGEKAPSTSFSFGPSSSTGEKTPSTSFSFGTSSSTGEKAPPASFSLGPSSSTGEEAPPASFSFNTPPTSGSSSTFTFGASSGSTSATPLSSSSATNPFGKTEVSSSLFGSNGSEPLTTSKTSSFGTFGKPIGTAGSLGNPVGFGFGFSSTTPGAGLPSTTPDAGPATPESSDRKENDEGSQEIQESGASEGSQGLITTNPHDEEGEGEEEEDTIHSARSKVFRFDKGDSGSSWADLGVGILRVKKHKETGARRILLRNSSTGKIILNFNLYSGLKPTQNKKSLTFVGHDEKGASQTYTIRLQGDEPATLLREALEREIAAQE